MCASQKVPTLKTGLFQTKSTLSYLSLNSLLKMQLFLFPETPEKSIQRPKSSEDKKQNNRSSHKVEIIISKPPELKIEDTCEKSLERLNLNHKECAEENTKPPQALKRNDNIISTGSDCTTGNKTAETETLKKRQLKSVTIKNKHQVTNMTSYCFTTGSKNKTDKQNSGSSDDRLEKKKCSKVGRGLCVTDYQV